MADGTHGTNESSTKKFRAGVDAALIELVRSRPVLYDPSHPRFMDNSLKNDIWIRIGKEVKANPSACKRRWYNIRDNYRKALRRRNLGGKLIYKFASMLSFLNPFFKGRVNEDPLAAPATSTTQKENSEDSNDVTEHSIVEEANEESAPPKTETNEDEDQCEADATSNQSESVIDCDMFDKSANVSGSYPAANSFANVSSNSSQSNVVDVFLAAIGPTLKGLSPYHLSLAKAEIFATVHKYELRGLVENGYAPDIDPLP